MPYDVTGYDSAGVLHTYVMADDGSVSGDDALLTGWLGDNPIPPPPDDAPLPEPGAPPTPERLEGIRQHYSKLLTGVQVTLQPVEGDDETPTDPGAPIDTQTPPPVLRYTAAELNAMTVAEVRELATARGILGAATMTKADMITQILAQQGG